MSRLMVYPTDKDINTGREQSVFVQFRSSERFNPAQMVAIALFPETPSNPGRSCRPIILGRESAF